MTFRSGQRVVCLYDSEAFVAVICGIPLEIPMVQLGIFCPRRGGVYTVAAVIAGWRGGCLELAELGSIWDARAFRAAVEDEFDALVEIAAHPEAPLKSPLTAAPLPLILSLSKDGRGARVRVLPEAVRLPLPLRTLALPAEAREDGSRRAAGGVSEEDRGQKPQPPPRFAPPQADAQRRRSPARGEGP